MNIQINSSQIKSYQAKIAEYDSKGFNKEIIGGNIFYKYLDPSLEPYSAIRLMMGEGLTIAGFPGYLRLSTADYTNNDVPVGVSYSEVIDANGDPTGIQKKWIEWQPTATMNRNDGLEVIIPTTYQSTSATPDDFDLFESAADVEEIMGLQELRASYQNNVLWILDENGDPYPDPPIDKTASYYVDNWQDEAFDFVHAQRLVNQWFQGLPGATETDKFNSLTGIEKKATIQWGVLDNTAEGKGLIEATILNKNNRVSYRQWNLRRGQAARAKRFDAAAIYLIDNFKQNAITTRIPEMYTYLMKEVYIIWGATNQSTHLIVNGEINPTFWATFTSGDVGYSDLDLTTIKAGVERILDGNSYINPLIN